MRNTNEWILVNDGSGIDKFRTIHGTLEARKVMQNEVDRQRNKHKGGNKKGSIPWNKGKRYSNEKATQK